MNQTRDPLIGRYPDAYGHFGAFGGRYVGETLMPALLELDAARQSAMADPAFLAEFRDLLRDYVGRPTPVDFAARLTAHAGGAQKVYWLLQRDGHESVVAVDCFAFTIEAGRVVGDQSVGLQLKAIYADGVKTKDIPITIKEDIQEPTSVCSGF